MPNFASRLREIRKEHSLRQKDLAQALGLAQTTIANYEQSTRFPDELTLSRIADFFGVSLDFLMGRTDVRMTLPPADLHPAAIHELDPRARAYLSALLEGSRERARDALQEAERSGCSLRELYTRVFQPVLVEVGLL